MNTYDYLPIIYRKLKPFGIWSVWQCFSGESQAKWEENMDGSKITSLHRNETGDSPTKLTHGNQDTWLFRKARKYYTDDWSLHI